MAKANEAQKLSAAAQKSLGLPEGFSLYSPFPFGGMNLQSSNIAIPDSEFVWRENYIRLGDGNLRTIPDKGPAFYTRTGTASIISFFFYYIGDISYVAIFFDDGTAIQVNTADATTTTISAGIGTFYVTGGGLPACVQWGSQYLIISNNNTSNDYWVWDGSLLYTGGTIAPDITINDTGRNYNSMPTATVYGGTGSGVVLNPIVDQGGVVRLEVLAPGSGYEIGDEPQVAFSGGGSDSSAILTANLGTGGVGSILVTDGGSGYTTATVTISGPSGSTATGVAVMRAFLGAYFVESITITNGGGGYVTPPTVTFSGGGEVAPASGTAVLIGGSVVSVKMTNGGKYSSAPSVIFSAAPAGTTATATATITAGAVSAITITDPGAGYTAPPIVTITGDGTLATAEAFLAGNTVGGVNVVDGGTGYTYAPAISFVGGGGTGAAGIVNLTPTSIAHVNVDALGSGYEAAPTVTFVGGGGSGAAATAIVAGGKVIAINITDGGYGYTTNPEVKIAPAGSDPGTGAAATAIFTPTSIISVTMSNYGLNYTTTPAIVIAPGANNAASASLSLMPYGVSGSAAEGYQGRIWLAHPKKKNGQPNTGDVILVSAPGSISNFATSDGGLLYTSNSPVLRQAYTAIKTVGDFLYPIGDSSVDVISNVQTSGSPVTTTLNENNTDPQVGTPWRNTVQDFSRTALFANSIGVYGLYGGAVTKLSEKLDELFENAIFPPTDGALTPSAAVAEIHQRKTYLMLLTVSDPFTGSPRNVMAAWDEREWFIASQSVMPSFIGTQIVESKPVAWGTDGTSLFPLMSAPSDSLTKILSTKLYGANNFPMVKLALSLHLMAEDLSDGLTGVKFTAGSLNTENEPYPLPSGLDFSAGASATPVVAGRTGDIFGCFLGLTLYSTSRDFTLKHLAIGYKVYWSGWGSPPSVQGS